MPNCIFRCYRERGHKKEGEPSLHGFPRNLDRIKVWLRQTRMDFGDLDKFAEKVYAAKKTDLYRLCSAHFTPECYWDTISRRKLRKDAIPTLFDYNSKRYVVPASRKQYRSSKINAGTQTHSDLGTHSIKENLSLTEGTSEAQVRVSKPEKSRLWKERSHVVTDPHRIEAIRVKFTKSVLDLVMEILCLLTKENTAERKKTSGDPLTPNPQMFKGSCTTKSPDMDTSPPSLTPESNFKKILEVTNKINELLMGEVPLPLQDVNVYFSMEESQYIEGPKDVITEDPHNQGDGSLYEVEVEVNNEPEESCVKDDETIMDIDIPPKTNTDPEATKSIKVKKEEEGHMRMKVEEVPKEISPDPSVARDTQKDIKVDKKKESVWMKEEEITSEISTGKICSNRTMNSSISYDSSSDDDITDNSSDEDPVTPKSPHDTDLSHHPPMCATSASEHSYLTSPHAISKEDKVVQTCVCFLCEESFSDKSTLYRHEQTHKMGKYYCCVKCEKKYSTKTEMVLHLRAHMGERPFLCSLCGTRYMHKSALLRHLNKCHQL